MGIPAAGKQLESYRVARGWSQSEVARRAGVHKATVARTEQGKAPLARNLTKMASALELTDDQLVTLYRAA